VISAFNSNKPFDQFTIEQIAGDLLPDATIEQKIASGYNRLIETTEEGGAQPKEYQAKNAADRVRNIGSAFLGSTMACCQCHDHKFDPFKQRDFYTMAAFFDDVKEPPIGRLTPELMLPTTQQKVKLAELDQQIAQAKSKLETDMPELAADQENWEQSVRINRAVHWHAIATTQATKASSKGGATLLVLDDGSIVSQGNNPDTDTVSIEITTDLKGITAFRLEVLPWKYLRAQGPGRAANGNFVLNEFKVETKAGDKLSPVALQNPSASHEQKDFGIAQVLNPDPKEKTKGWAILDHTGKASSAVFETTSDLGDAKAARTIVFTLRQEYGSQHSIGHFRLSATTEPRPVRADSVPKDIRDIVAVDKEKRTDEQKKTLTAYYRTISPKLADLRNQLAAAEKKRTAVVEGTRKTLISVSDTPRVTRILRRGDWMDESGQIVQPATPMFLNPVASSTPPTTQPTRQSRLDLARWVVSRDNPLTARVFVNRLWKMYFGQGLAQPLDDLGSQGTAPTHPELLDYLAVEFMDSGWDVKRVIRLMVTSHTYRQSSTPALGLVEADPFNKWLARQGRFRLDAEFVRDNALSVAGVLNTTIGGESVKPYQPDGYWEFLNFPKRTYEASTGSDQYRRGLYTHWQRTFLHPSLVNFDAPSREECTAQRPASNTPQQALTLLNDPTYVEAARLFAQRILSQPLYSTDHRLVFAFRQALSRQPRPEEIKVLDDLLQRQREHFSADKASASAVVSVGQAPAPKELDVVELASWTNLSRAILNLHETITRK